MFDAVLAAGTLVVHWLLGKPRWWVWLCALGLDLGWGILYFQSRLRGPLVMTIVFVIIHTRNLYVASGGKRDQKRDNQTSVEAWGVGN